jgi:maleylpyruvate isomerase
MDSSSLPRSIEGARASQERLLRSVQTFDDERARGPSLLPGWTRGHLLTHLARNADSHVRVLEGARRRETVEQYVGGKDGRAAAIEAGANRPASELVGDVESSERALSALWDEITDDVWDKGWIAISGGKPAWFGPFARWRETEIHHVDLDAGYSIEDWPLDFVQLVLGDEWQRLRRRLPRSALVTIEASDVEFAVGSGDRRVVAPGRVLLAWVTGRLPDGDAIAAGLPSLSPWM